MKVGQLQKQVCTLEKSTLQHYTDELQGSFTIQLPPYYVVECMMGMQCSYTNSRHYYVIITSTAAGVSDQHKSYNICPHRSISCSYPSHIMYFIIVYYCAETTSLNCNYFVLHISATGCPFSNQILRKQVYNHNSSRKCPSI